MWGVEGSKEYLTLMAFSDFITRKINIALLFILVSKVVCKLGNRMQSSVYTFLLFPKETIKAVFQWNIFQSVFLGEYW